MAFTACLQADPTPAMVPPPATTSNKPATNVPPAVPAPPEYLNRYGNILVPGDGPAYPFKLMLPSPWVGEIKIPTQDEVNMRDKMEALATLSDDDIRTQLNEWPAYSKMKLADEGAMLMRIQQFREHRTNLAMEKAPLMGLSTLTKEQKIRFEKEYWDKRLKMEKELVKQFEPIVKDRESKMQAELFRDFSSTPPVGVPAQASKPPSPGTASNSPAAQPKSPPAPVPAATPPVAQAQAK